MELLTEKSISSIYPLQLSPGDAVRRIFEAVAGGVVLSSTFIYILNII